VGLNLPLFVVYGRDETGASQLAPALHKKCTAGCQPADGWWYVLLRSSNSKSGLPLPSAVRLASPGN